MRHSLFPYIIILLFRVHYYTEFYNNVLCVMFDIILKLEGNDKTIIIRIYVRILILL